MRKLLYLNLLSGRTIDSGHAVQVFLLFQLFLLPLHTVALPLGKWLCVNSKNYSLRLGLFMVLNLLLCFFTDWAQHWRFIHSLVKKKSPRCGSIKKKPAFTVCESSVPGDCPSCCQQQFFYSGPTVKADLHVTDGTMAAVNAAQPVGYSEGSIYTVVHKRLHLSFCFLGTAR